MDILAPFAVMMLGVGMVGLALGIIFTRKRPLAAPQKPQTDVQVVASPEVVSRLLAVEAAQRGLTSELVSLRADMDLRHRSLTGFIAKKMGKRAAEEAEQLELPPGPERDALIDRVIGTGTMDKGSPPGADTGIDDPNTWPMHLVSGDRTRRLR